MLYETTVLICAEPEAVWRVLMDVEHWPEWTPTMKSVRLQGGGGLSVGSRARILQPKLLPANWDVTSMDTGTSFAWATRRGGVTILAVHELAPAGAGRTNVRLSIEFQGGPLAALAGKMYGGMTSRSIATEAAGLKQYIEAGEKSADSASSSGS
jgi:uncharacterized membrane protein